MSVAVSVKIPSERSFGFQLSALAALFGAYCVYRGRQPIAYMPLFAFSSVMAILTTVAPRTLGPFHIAWSRVGDILSRLVSPVFLGIIFFGVVTPIAYVTRLRGRDALHIRQQAVSSYWINRNPPGPGAASFKNQF